MNRFVLAAGLATALLPAAPALARDTSGYTLRTTALRAGPDNDYPRIARIRGNLAVVVHGCLDDRSWCDVSRRNARGWIEGPDLAVNYRGRRTELRAGLGIGVLSFMFGDYWNDHYRSQSFYGQRSRWEPQAGRRDEQRRNDQPGAMNGMGGQQGWQQRQPGAPLDRTIPGAQAPRPRDWQPMVAPDRSVPVRPAPDRPLSGNMPGMSPPLAAAPPVAAVPHQPEEIDAGKGNGRHRHAD